MKLCFALSLLVLSIACYSQSTYPIRADKVLIERVGGSAELQIKNSTRDSLYGILTNIGAGQTTFLKIKKISDSSFAIGLDTITIRGNNPRPVDDFVYTLDESDAVDTASYSTACTTTEVFSSHTFPQYIGKRIRVKLSGAELSSDDTACFYFKFNNSTGELKIYPGYKPSEGWLTGPGYDTKLVISTY